MSATLLNEYGMVWYGYSAFGGSVEAKRVGGRACEQEVTGSIPGRSAAV